MAKWTFEPGHTAAEFCARHMMVTYVRGHFKDVHGTLNFNIETPGDSSVEVIIDARKIWTGEPARDAHLRSADFLDVENFPEITFKGNQVVVIEAVGNKYKVYTGPIVGSSPQRSVVIVQIMDINNDGKLDLIVHIEGMDGSFALINTGTDFKWGS